MHSGYTEKKLIFHLFRTKFDLKNSIIGKFQTSAEVVLLKNFQNISHMLIELKRSDSAYGVKLISESIVYWLVLLPVKKQILHNHRVINRNCIIKKWLSGYYWDICIIDLLFLFNVPCIILLQIFARSLNIVYCIGRFI